MKRTTGKTVFLLCNLYVSAVVGAGFATGQEIMGFFTCYGPAGFAGVLVAGIVFMVVGPLILRKAIVYDAYSMGELMSFRFGKKGENLMKIINLLLEFSVLIVMLAGLRTLLNQMGLPNFVAVVLLAAGLFAVSFHKNVALRMNNILTPIVILGIMITCSLLLAKNNTWVGWSGAEVETAYPWWISALLYAGFNLLLAMPALCLAGKTLQREGVAAMVGGVLGGLCIGSMALLSHSLIFAYGAQMASMQMPVVELTMAKMPWFGRLYQGIIFSAMASSAVICTRCIVDLFPHGKKGRNRLSTALVCVLAGVLSFLDFSRLIGILYPLFGGVGILAVLFILW